MSERMEISYTNGKYRASKKHLGRRKLCERIRRKERKKRRFFRNILHTGWNPFVEILVYVQNCLYMQQQKADLEKLNSSL